MIKKLLFIQPFVLKREQLSKFVLIWPLYLENFLKTKIDNLISDLLYFPFEKDKGKINIQSFSEVDKFYSQMDNLIPDLNFQIDKNTIICISGTTSHHYLSSKLIAEYFQKYFPKTIIVFGGAHASACPKDFSYRNSPIDYVIIGEGELAMSYLIKQDLKKQSQPKIIKNNPISELDNLPPLDFSIFNKYAKSLPNLSIVLSRGCPFNCNFCMEKSLSVDKIKRWRSYSPKRAVQEIECMLRYGADYKIKDYGIYDPTFGFNKKWLTDLLNIYNPNDEISCLWTETRFDVLDFKMLKIMQKKKIYQMYGLESCSKRMLEIMNKTANPKEFLDKFEKLFEMHRELEYTHMLNVLFNHPGETKETILENFEGLKKIEERDSGNVALFNLRYYHHFPGTRNYNNIEGLHQKHGTIAYFPEWWKKESLLTYAPYCIRSSRKLPLRDSIEKYTDCFEELGFINIKNLKKCKQNNSSISAFFKKREINKVTQLKKDLLNFLDENNIESEKIILEI